MSLWASLRWSEAVFPCALMFHYNPARILVQGRLIIGFPEGELLMERPPSCNLVPSGKGSSGWVIGKLQHVVRFHNNIKWDFLFIFATSFILCVPKLLVLLPINHYILQNIVKRACAEIAQGLGMTVTAKLCQEKGSEWQAGRQSRKHCSPRGGRGHMSPGSPTWSERDPREGALFTVRTGDWAPKYVFKEIASQKPEVKMVKRK